jgi:hypothetical protein
MTDDGASTAPEPDPDRMPVGESWLAEQLRLIVLEDGRGL